MLPEQKALLAFSKLLRNQLSTLDFPLIAETLKKICDVAEIMGYTPLKELSDSLRLFAASQADNQTPFIKDQVTVLVQITDEIQAIAQDEQLRDKLNIPNEKLNNFKVIVDSLRKKSGKTEIPQINLPFPDHFTLEEIKKGDGGFFELIDPLMVEEFYQTVGEKILVLNSGILAIEKRGVDEEIHRVRELIDVAQTIANMAERINLPLLSLMMKTVAEKFQEFEEVQGSCSQEAIDHLFQCIDTIDFVRQVKPRDIERWIGENRSKIEELINYLAVEPKKKEVEEPKPDTTMLNLLRIELETQVANLNNGLIDLEHNPDNVEVLSSLMRYSHSIKGATRVVQLDPIVKLAHAMEDFFSSAQNNSNIVTEANIDFLLQAVDVLNQLISTDLADINAWVEKEKNQIAQLTQSIQVISRGLSLKTGQKRVSFPKKKEIPEPPKAQERILRVGAQSLNRLMGLAGETLVHSRWLQPFLDSFVKLKKEQVEISTLVDRLSHAIQSSDDPSKAKELVKALENQMILCRDSISRRLIELELFNLRISTLAERLYQEVINNRMRPFSDIVESFPRMVRDAARRMNKKVKLEIIGRNTTVDRDILEKLETPLNHLLRNAVVHGIGTPKERMDVGKPPEGTIRLEAKHVGGMLSITVADDGKGINFEKVRKKIVEDKLVPEEIAKNLNDTEVMEFLFLPGFSTSKDLTELSGRGLGLNIVQNMVKEVGGTARITYTTGRGMTITLNLPLTLSVIRALLVIISGEPYAFPLSRIDRALLIPKSELKSIDNQVYFQFEENTIPVAMASGVLELKSKEEEQDLVPIIIISNELNNYGLIVDKFIEERELVIQELEPKLGKVANIIAGSVMDDGSPVLIVDIENLLKSTALFLKEKVEVLLKPKEKKKIDKPKQILVADDSPTIIGIECRILEAEGYKIETAVNGIEALKLLRIGNYDLLVTDIDMPKMNGIELMNAIRKDIKLHSLPIIVVSFKNEPDDKAMGLEAGADIYLTKSSFTDESFVKAVATLLKKER